MGSKQLYKTKHFNGFVSVLLSITAMTVTTGAWANAAPASSTEQMLTSFLPLMLMFGVLYFLMIRPQMKRQKEHRTLLEALQKGDEVIAAGGLLGRVVKLNESYVTLEVALLGDRANDKAVEVLVQRGAIQMVLPKGTLKDQR